MLRLTALLLALTTASLAADLPTGETPPGKVVLVPQPHHDDHSTDYGMAGLIARLVDEGYRAIYIRASNDEKDGRHGYARNDIINLRETEQAVAVLGMEKVNRTTRAASDSVPRGEKRTEPFSERAQSCPARFGWWRPAHSITSPKEATTARTSSCLIPTAKPTSRPSPAKAAL